ncbi:hypothetical protein EI42_02003 [Thermosporothrix hazakensis]|jgi:hypothetical protein|uniref:Cytochrome b561 domain-containing protein n=1 Tax=Thermosporothrix hazakensis TaxID=644383 RepID=A0A326UIJ6_THEHA|nr:DUF6220 domain-containing protein [Thermosporothrix hazakensis]PZW31978.1 hypothetical protein EI42_02003 [Thermosporothrix hazakensis]GCE49696.1 hypothetical protein KTH_45650 [Thermosporothrix hazakensis]
MRYCFLVAAILTELGIVIQVFFAGAGIFAQGSWFMYHGILGSTIFLLPLLQLVFGLLGRLPWKINLLSVLVAILIIVQPFLIYPFRAAGIPIVAALHPVNAMLIFLLALTQVLQGRKYTRTTNIQPE